MRKRATSQPGECFGKFTNYRACQECVLKDRCRAEVLKDSVLRTADERRGGRDEATTDCSHDAGHGNHCV